MKLECIINNKTYPITQGATFSEEYNETLDSGAIIISQQKRITNLKQFDLVHIFEPKKDITPIPPDIISVDETNSFVLNQKNNIEDVVLKADLMYYFVFSTYIEMSFEVKEPPLTFYGTIHFDTKEKLPPYFRYKNKLYPINQATKSCDLGRDLTIQEIEIIRYGGQFAYLNVVIHLDKKNSAEDRIVFDNVSATYFPNENKYTFDKQLSNAKIFVYYKIKTIDKYYAIANFTESQILRNNTYQYTINLMSETKLLEGILCPNLTITQKVNPFTHEFEAIQRSVADYMVLYTNLYAPKIKVALPTVPTGTAGTPTDAVGTYVPAPKYTFDTKSNAWNLLANTICPEMSFGNQNLREVLQTLANVCDLLPYVEHNVIKFHNLSKPVSLFDDTNCNSIECSQMGDDYMNGTRVSFQNAINTSQLTYHTKNVGFRDRNSLSLNSLENLKIEFNGQKIYRIDRFIIKYLKVLNLKVPNQKGETTETVWIKQDITPLLLHNTVRNLLNPRTDFYDETGKNIRRVFLDTNENITNIYDMANYKYLTIGYDIGSDTISGFSDVYEIPYNNFLVGEKNAKHTNLETILDYINFMYPFGNASEIDNSKYNFNLGKLFTDECKSKVIPTYGEDFFKGLCFEISYYSMNDFDMDFFKQEEITNEATDYMRRDNQGNSLAILENYSSNEQSKINRYGNKQYNFKARVKDFEDVNDVGSLYEKEEDVIIYHRELSIYDNFIVCNYAGTKKYLLKDYYTSLSAKHRTYSVMSYEESVSRNEVRNYFFEISKTAYSTQDLSFKSENDSYLLFATGLKPHPLYKLGEPDHIYSFKNLKDIALNDIDLFYMEATYKDGTVSSDKFSQKEGKFALEQVNIGVKNYLVFNFKIPDNYSLGSYIKDPKAFNVFDFVYKVAETTGQIMLEKDDRLYTENKVIKGAIQSYYQYADYYGEYGMQSSRREPITLKFAKSRKDFVPINENTYDFSVFRKPKLSVNDFEKDIFTFKDTEILKDNKEKLNYSLEFSYYTRDKNIMIGDYFAKLNDLVNRENALIKNVDGKYTIINDNPVGLEDKIKIFVRNKEDIIINLDFETFSLLEMNKEYEIVKPIGFYDYWTTRKYTDYLMSSWEYYMNTTMAIFDKIKRTGKNTCEVYSTKEAQDSMFLPEENVETNNQDYWSIFNGNAHSPNNLKSFNGLMLYELSKKYFGNFSTKEAYYPRTITFYKDKVNLTFNDKTQMLEGRVGSVKQLYNPPHQSYFEWNSKPGLGNFYKNNIGSIVANISDYITNNTITQYDKINMFYVRLNRALNKYEADNLKYGFVPLSRDFFSTEEKDTEFQIGFEETYSIPYVEFKRIKNPENLGFIGIYYYYNNEYHLIFGFNHLENVTSEKFYGNMKESKNDLVYDSVENQNIVGKVAELKDIAHLTDKKNKFVKD